MVGGGDCGLAGGGEGGEDEGGGGAEVGGGDVAGGEAVDAGDFGGVVAELDVSAHTCELFDVGEALWKNEIGNGALAVGD